MQAGGAESREVDDTRSHGSLSVAGAAPPPAAPPVLLVMSSAPAVAATAAVAASSSSSSAASPSMQSASGPTLHNFSVPWMDTFIHAQVWLLSSSVFVWLGDSSCSFQALSCAMPSPWDPAPSASCLLGRGGNPVGAAGGSDVSSQGGQSSSESDEVSLGMSTRLAKVFGMPVFLSLNLSAATLAGGGAADLVPGGGAAGSEVFVYLEKAIIKELKTCEKRGMITRPANMQ